MRSCTVPTDNVMLSILGEDTPPFFAHNPASYPLLKNWIEYCRPTVYTELVQENSLKAPLHYKAVTVFQECHDSLGFSLVSPGIV